VSYQSFGEFARFHPHWHVLVLEGGFTERDRFVYLPLTADEGLLKVWREAMLAMFLKKSFIDQAKVTMIRSWGNSGFSVESETRLFTKADREALGQYVVRGAVCLEKVKTWKKVHTEGQNQSAQEDKADGDELVPPDAWARLRRHSWARLLQKVYEVDPFLCPKCGGAMSVVAVIEDPGELRKIIEWVQANQVRGPPVMSV
jgi:hypothetical protein